MAEPYIASAGSLLDLGNAEMDVLKTSIGDVGDDTICAIAAGDTVLRNLLRSVLDPKHSTYDVKMLLINAQRSASVEDYDVVQQRIINMCDRDTTLLPVARYLLTDIGMLFNSSADKYAFLGLSDKSYNIYLREHFIPKLQHKTVFLTQYDKEYTFTILSLMYSCFRITPSVLPRRFPDTPAKISEHTGEGTSEHTPGDKSEDTPALYGKFNDIVDAVVPVRLKGPGHTQIAKATRLFSILAPNWSNMSAAITLRNTPDAGAVGASNDSSSDEDIINIYSGAYDLVPSTTPEGNIDHGLVSNYTAFNALPKNRQRQVGYYLSANRKRFTHVLHNSTHTIMDFMRNYLTDSNVSNELYQHQGTLAPQLASSVGMDSSNVLIDARSFMGKLRAEYDKSNAKTVYGAIDFIVNKYIPMVSQFEGRCNAVYGNATLQRFSSIPLFSFMSAIKAPVTSMSRPVRIRGGNVDDDEITTVGGAATVNLDTSVHTDVLGPGTSSASDDVLSDFIDGQLRFNTAYEELYRDLTKEMNAVKLSDTRTQLSNLYTVCDSVESISIKSPMTTVYISGYYGSRNYNNMYKQSLTELLNNISESGLVQEFTGVRSVIERMVKLQETTLEDVNRVRNKFLRAPKAISEMVVFSSERIKRPCALENRDFVALSDAIRRLRNAVKSSMSDDVEKSTKAQLNNYIAKVKDRSKIIEEHYRMELMYVTNDFSTQTRIRNRGMIGKLYTDILNTRRDCLLYLNDKLDIVLTRYRIDSIGKTSLTTEQIDRIERALLMLKNSLSSREFKRQVDELTKLFNVDTSIGSVFELVKRIKKLVISSQYVDFIQMLYKELDIFPRDFDWREFVNKFTTLIAISAIELTGKVYVGTTSYTHTSFIHHIAQLFETFVHSNQLEYHKHNAAYLMILDILSPGSPLPTGVEVNLVDMPPDAELLRGILVNPGFPNEDKARLVAWLQPLLTKYKSITPKPYYITHFDTYAVPLYGFLNNPAFANHESVDEMETLINTHRFDEQDLTVNLIGGDPTRHGLEIKLIKHTIDALMVNVLGMVDDYWNVRYKGTLNLPINISTLLRGGNNDGEDKTDGGTVFDTLKIRSPVNELVIPEATPFYICAFNVCSFYMNNYSSKGTRPEIKELKMKVNKLSPLYPVYEVFGGLKSAPIPMNNLTPSQIKRCVSVFNEMWNMGTGNHGARLSYAIDMLFNELNACFIFTDKIQLDLIDSTGTLSGTVHDTLYNDIDGLVKVMGNTIRDTFMDYTLSPATQSKYFETTLADAYKRMQNEPVSQRIALLKTLLTSQNTSDDIMHEYYKFMELVVTPLLLCSQSYMNVFRLFDSYTFERDPAGGAAYNEVIDLRKTRMFYIDPNMLERYRVVNSIWNLVTAITRDGRVELKALFLENPVVLQWNRILLYNALEQFHKLGRFVLPDFWVVMDENSYPKQPTLKSQNIEQFTTNENLALIHQLWPNMQVNNRTTLLEYYRHAVNELTGDFEHYVQAFVSYPGISDKMRVEVARSAKDAIKRFEELGDRGAGLDEIIVNKVNMYIPPPAYTIDTYIPVYATSNIGELVVIDTLSSGTNTGAAIDGTTLAVTGLKVENNTTTSYTWVDWVLFKLAQCDKVGYCLPARFVDILESSPLSEHIKRAALGHKGEMSYANIVAGKYYNIITQNILARSASEINREKLELSSLSTSWLASIIAISPYLISTLKTHADMMDGSVMYNGVNAVRIMNYLIALVTNFYNEAISFSPHMEFMSDYVAPTSSAAQAHTFAELLAFMFETRAHSMTSSDFIKMAWANKYFFCTLDGIQYPEFKNRDAFEWMNKYAADKVNNSVFRSEYDSTIQTMARNAWACLIASSQGYNHRFRNITRQDDEIIVRCINVLSECDKNIIQEYIDNIIESRTITARTRLVGGNTLNTYTPRTLEDLSDDVRMLVEALTKNIVPQGTTDVIESRVLPPTVAYPLPSNRLVPPQMVIASKELPVWFKTIVAKIKSSSARIDVKISLEMGMKIGDALINDTRHITHRVNRINLDYFTRLFNSLRGVRHDEYEYVMGVIDTFNHEVNTALKTIITESHQYVDTAVARANAMFELQAIPGDHVNNVATSYENIIEGISDSAAANPDPVHGYGPVAAGLNDFVNSQIKPLAIIDNLISLIAENVYNAFNNAMEDLITTLEAPSGLGSRNLICHALYMLRFCYSQFKIVSLSIPRGHYAWAANALTVDGCINYDYIPLLNLRFAPAAVPAIANAIAAAALPVGDLAHAPLDPVAYRNDVIDYYTGARQITQQTLVTIRDAYEKHLINNCRILYSPLGMGELDNPFWSLMLYYPGTKNIAGIHIFPPYPHLGVHHLDGDTPINKPPSNVPLLVDNIAHNWAPTVDERNRPIYNGTMIVGHIADNAFITGAGARITTTLLAAVMKSLVSVVGGYIVPAAGAAAPDLDSINSGLNRLVLYASRIMDTAVRAMASDPLLDHGDPQLAAIAAANDADDFNNYRVDTNVPIGLLQEETNFPAGYYRAPIIAGWTAIPTAIRYAKLFDDPLLTDLMTKLRTVTDYTLINFGSRRNNDVHTLELINPPDGGPGIAGEVLRDHLIAASIQPTEMHMKYIRGDPLPAINEPVLTPDVKLALNILCIGNDNPVGTGSWYYTVNLYPLITVLRPALMRVLGIDRPEAYTGLARIQQRYDGIPNGVVGRDLVSAKTLDEFYDEFIASYLRKLHRGMMHSALNFVTHAIRNRVSNIRGIMYHYVSGAHNQMNALDYNTYPFNRNVRAAVVERPNNAILIGGTGGENLRDTEVIIETARGIAKNYKNKAMYVDPTYTLDKVVPSITNNGIPDLDNTLLHALYINPNLCTLFNKTGIDNEDYMRIIAAARSKYIIDPDVPEFVARSRMYVDIDFSKYQYKLPEAYHNMIRYWANKVPAAAAEVIPANDTWNRVRFPDDTPVNFMVDGDMVRYMTAMRLIWNVGYYNNGANAAYNDVLVLPYQQHITNNGETTYDAESKSNIPFDNRFEAITAANIRVREARPYKFIYKNYNTTRRSNPVHIKFNPMFFSYLFANRTLDTYLFSPQKDIYNATLIDIYTQERAPVILHGLPPQNIIINHGLIHSIMNQMVAYGSFFNDIDAQADLRSISNYNGYASIIIHDFIRTLLTQANTATLTSGIADYGFDTGKLMGGSFDTRISGGYVSDIGFIERYVNVSNISSSVSAKDKLASLYTNKDDPEYQMDGLRLYNTIFQRINTANKPTDDKFMFSLVISYFHKYNVSFNSIYNQMCFPSILYGAASLRVAISNICSAIDGINIADSATTDMDYKARLMRFIKTYMQAYAGTTDNALDLTDEIRYQTNHRNEPRKVINTYESLIDEMDAITRQPRYDANKTLWMANQYSAPSVANDFLSMLVTAVAPSTPDMTVASIKRPENHITQLFNSSLMNIFRHIDSISTFVSVVFLLLKQTSHYDVEYKRDREYIGRDNPEPFSAYGF